MNLNPFVTFVLTLLVIALCFVDPASGSLAAVSLVAAVFVRNESSLLKLTAAGGETPGSIIQFNGRVWVAQFQRIAEAGETIAYRDDLVCEIDKDTPTEAFAVGADLFYDPVTENGFSAQAGSNFLAGKVRKASGAADKTVFFALNE